MIPSFFWAVAPLSRSWTDRGRTLWIGEPARLITILSVVLTGRAHRLHLDPEGQEESEKSRQSCRQGDLSAAYQASVAVCEQKQVRDK